MFDLIRQQRHSSDAVLISFDLIELEGEDLRGSPIEHRKRKLAKLVRGHARAEAAPIDKLRCGWAGRGEAPRLECSRSSPAFFV